MLPAVARKCSGPSKEKSYRKIKEKKSKHKLKSKSKSYKKNSGFTFNKNLVQYSDVSSEELSSPEAGEIHSDFDEKHGGLRLNPPNKIVTDKIRITRIVTSPLNLLAACSPLSNHWELDSIPEDSSMSTNFNLNNCIDITSEVTNRKYKKNKKNNKKPKSPSSKKKKKKKDLKRKSDVLPDCDNSTTKFSKVPNLELSKRNGDFTEPDKKPSIEVSHTPPLTKSDHIKVSKVEVTHKEDEKCTKHHRKEDKR